MADSAKQTNAESVKIRTKELTDKLEAGMKQLYDSEKYKHFLNSMARFHQYSPRNIMLIHQQMPDATRVASFNLWKKTFNRHVRKGEKGLYIHAPMTGKRTETKRMEKLDPETGAPLLDATGKVIMQEKTELKSVPRFKLVPVFDVSQTVGDPLPELVEDVSGKVTHYEAFLDSLRAVSSLPIVFEAMPPEQDGYCLFGERIGIREGMSEAQTIGATIHEISHERLHDRKGLDADASAKTKAVKEIESESISYVVCQHYGIETSQNSFGYLAEHGSGDLSELKASLDTIRKESNKLITAIDGNFGIICKERGIDLEKNLNKPEHKPEPSYSLESRTETIAGVDFQVSDVIRETEKSHDASIAKGGGACNIEILMPDPAISLSERDRFGYTFEGQLPLTKCRAMDLFGKGLSVYCLYPDNTEAMAFEGHHIEDHDGLFGIDRDEWLESEEHEQVLAQQREAGKESKLTFGDEDAFAIYQLKRTDETWAYRLESLERLERQNLAVDRGNYDLCYTAPLPDEETLAGIYQRFNLDRPADFTGHSLSVSDVIVIQRDGEMSSHYVDGFGFTELPCFLGNEREPSPVQPKQVVENESDLNRACGRAIDRPVIDSNYELHRYDLKKAVRSVIDEFGVDRVALVLASNVNHYEWDGRLSDSNKEWAYNLGAGDKPDHYLQTHLYLLNGYVDRFREVVKEKPSLLETLARNEMKSRQQGKTLDIGMEERVKPKKAGREGL